MTEKNLYLPTGDRLMSDLRLILGGERIWQQIAGPTKRGSRVLEIGAGTGKIGMMFAVWADCEVTLMDVDINACRYQGRLKDMIEAMAGGGDLSVIISHKDIFKDDVKPRYDIVISEGVVEHYVDENRQKLIDLHYKSTLDKAVIVTTNGENVQAVAKATSRTEEFELATKYERPYRRLELQGAMERAGFNRLIVNYLVNQDTGQPSWIRGEGFR